MKTDKNQPTSAVIRAARIFETAVSWVAVEKLAKITAEQALVRPAPGLNHIHWLLGHITVSCDIAPYINGADRVINGSFNPLFDIGTKPGDDASGYPTIAEILKNFEKGVDNSLAAIKSISDDDLALPPVKPLGEPLSQYFTNRHDIINGFATHITYHGGQIGTVLSLLEKHKR